jgi:hypothetical protein
MSVRPIPVVLTAIVTVAFAAGTAGAQSPTDNPAPGAIPGACADQSAPTSSFTARAGRRAASRKHLLRGTAGDVGCGLDTVAISVNRKSGTKCRALKKTGKLARKSSCSKRRWLAVNGGAKWSFKLSRKLPAGTYVIRTRAVDFAGNVQRPKAHRVKLAKRPAAR